jgi:capsid protein
MDVYNKIVSFFTTPKPVEQEVKTPTPKAHVNWVEYPINDSIFDGEKNFGELGAPVNYIPDYAVLSARSWKLYTDNTMVRLIINSRIDWIIGQGLTLSAQPMEDVIKRAGYDFDKEEFETEIEPRLKLYTNTIESVYNRNCNFKKIERLAELHASVGGDCLLIFRTGKYGATVQLIDGRSIRTPMDAIAAAEENGNKIIHGVEINGSTGEHLAYYVFKNDHEYERIERFGKKTGRLQAVMKYGTEWRIDSVRGMPFVSVMAEKMQKVDRYEEAAVGAEEERVNVPYVFVHDKNSAGYGVQTQHLMNTIDADSSNPDANGTTIEEATKATVKTSNKEPIDLPIGVTMETLDVKKEAFNPEFIDTIFIYACAVCKMPYELVLMKYVNSFSSSRMATQSLLHLLLVQRKESADVLNKPFYNLQLEYEILTNKVKADGFLQAIISDDLILKEAYTNAQFIGVTVPQADPLKEVISETTKLENNLTDYESAIEALNGKDFVSTVTKKANQIKRLEELGLNDQEEQSQNNTE